MQIELEQLGLKSAKAKAIVRQLDKIKKAEQVWEFLVSKVFKNTQPFAIQRIIYEKVYAEWNHEKSGPPPAWTPSEETIKESNIQKVLNELKLQNYDDLYSWSINEREKFWNYTVKKLKIKLHKKYKRVFSGTPQHPNWLVGAKLNIADSCFMAPAQKTAIIFQSEGRKNKINKMSYGELKKLSCQVANGLRENGFVEGDRVGIAMPMTAESVAIYLGIVMAGCAVVSIADSFAPDEIATRLRISNAKAVFTQDHIIRSGKKLPMYEKVVAANPEKIIVLPSERALVLTGRANTIYWDKFLSKKKTFKSLPSDPNEITNVLFSSGTTGDPKAIPWTHVTPIKCAADGFFYHDVHAGDILTWPTNLGWMMGPWLIYATLINKGTIALYYGAPTGREFGEFVQRAKVNVLGLVPSIVKAWRNTDCMKNLKWDKLKLFSSTGECSNVDDYLFVMSLANYKPVIEYCGGTEIGGGYVTGTVVQKASPSTFTTPALGLELVILDEKNHDTNFGELYLVPPSIGLSQELLNKNHDEVYFHGSPARQDGKILRRHGDEVEKLPGGYWRAHGRADDTMNLGGIKVSSAEIERTLNYVDGVSETAAIAVTPPGGGPSLLVIFAVLKNERENQNLLKEKMQNRIREKLNPLFKIQDVKIVDSLPRTASNKIMRRALRQKV
ncbi:MAG: AMP-dependent synthetase [Proteobacteria bacterium SG_bin7]|nr:MAG: AMP-dependent synthetase [Proteobacteria bacterium SG_bin7]